MRQSQVENALNEKNVLENASDKSQTVTGTDVRLKRRRKKSQETGRDATKSNDNLSAVPKYAFSTETSTTALAVPPTHPDEHTLDSAMRQAQVENESIEMNVIENSSDKSQNMTGAELSLTKKRRKKKKVKGHDAVESNDNLSSAPKDAFSTETSTTALTVPPTNPDEHSLDSAMRQCEVENALNERNVLENTSNKPQIMTSGEVSSRNKRKRKRKQGKGHDASESNNSLSAVSKYAFSAETSTVALAVPPTHPDHHYLNSVMRQSQVENALSEKNVLENASDKSQIMMSGEVSSRNKRNKGQGKRHDAGESNNNLSAVPKDAFSTETSTAALAVPPTHPDEHPLDSVMRQSQVESALNEKNVLENTSDKPQIMTSVEVSLRNKRKRKKRKGKGHDASESNNNLSAVPKDTLSAETSTAPRVMPPTHPFQQSVGPLTRQFLAENEGKENHVLQHVTDGYLATTYLDVNSSKKNKKRKKKARHSYIETNVNFSGVPKDGTSLETSSPILDLPPLHSGQSPIGPVMRLSQEANEEVQNMIGKATDGSAAVAIEEVSSRKKNKKRKRRKTRCNDIECDINHHDVLKDTFSPETCILTLDVPSQYPALDVVMNQCPEENQGKDPNMIEKATDGSLAMTSVEVNARKKNKVGRRRKKARHDSLQSNVNLSDVSKGDISHLTLVRKHDHSEASHFSIGRAISSYPKKKLLVLDLNGLLADFVLGVPEGYKPDKKIHNKAVFKRPFCEDFLQFCFDKFHVGIWSSRKWQNASAAIKILVGVSASKLLFAWDQRHCTKTKFQTIEDKDKPLMMKELRKLWEKSRPGLPWEKGEFNETNTLLLDDSPYKAIRNPLHTAIFPYSYRYNDTNDTSLGPGGDLRVYLEGLAMAENVQEYVASHPFGQPPITESNPHWNFYCNVRDQGLVTKKGTKKRYRHNRHQCRGRQ